MKLTKFPPYEWIMFGYLAFSVIVSVFARPTQSFIVTAIGASAPTARWLIANGNDSAAVYFFCMNLALLPVATALAISIFVSGLEPKRQPTWPTLFGLIALLSVLAWFAWFIPADFHPVGTRFRAIQSLCAHTRIGLGIIYGILFLTIAIGLSAIPSGIKNIRNAKA